MIDIKKEILNNRDDLIKGIFCYVLFEYGIFDIDLLDALVLNARDYL
ncbi:hypothetical protein [Commensalibacter communis]|nr:hypothetical protein [Commensalibacter communis]